MADKDRFGGSHKTYQQPRKSEYTAETMQKEFALGMGTMAAATTGMGAGLVLSTAKETPAEKKARLNRSSRGGGGGGIYDVAQPLTNKNLINKWKKLK